ncbi:MULTISPECIES: holo-[acyl-carrier-protein] synthase [Geobacter]|jgi:holo-[acyl-carrier protein] synthase|uniref:Holo-[acyl-carrier-protein] synthase n=2 Tax=Geobacter TaxID=28231 RepID=ACPS_GEOSL|nr:MULTISPECIES: holo-[acyl-carrier-protein] synthase [Geobacter]Q74C71.1 RecName: Full=Holo-[acyl-carrier-protein] synthase; Short=Holo-ACP synthase; AltName: Full=4'-phosphopantetheinyl transferase AcpS [Geobacter sulfurreducens PCA]AAR35180.1 acyl carrier protein 4'-phosphopantetheinyltransferase [Geobacter sulfurreducens PCA]ADI84638.1 acyl carrier protein 4'-phosphopantetheinyltransferase [Geobacter sulfurreducens KN400]AJY71141.1 4'-phosphopantetheinyl transferase [Geobacter sulfurreducen
MIFGTGIDIVDITRFDRLVEEGNVRLFERLFTPHEMEYCAGKARSSQHYALRFAAKEAFLKACGLGLREGMTWHDVEVVNDTLGKPELKLHGKALKLATDLSLSRTFVSLSHDGAYAVALVVLERP